MEHFKIFDNKKWGEKRRVIALKTRKELKMNMLDFGAF